MSSRHAFVINGNDADGWGYHCSCGARNQGFRFATNEAVIEERGYHLRPETRPVTVAPEAARERARRRGDPAKRRQRCRKFNYCVRGNGHGGRCGSALRCCSLACHRDAAPQDDFCGECRDKLEAETLADAQEDFDVATGQVVPAIGNEISHAPCLQSGCGALIPAVRAFCEQHGSCQLTDDCPRGFNHAGACGGGSIEGGIGIDGQPTLANGVTMSTQIRGLRAGLWNQGIR